jgi:hypothetical protein
MEKRMVLEITQGMKKAFLRLLDAKKRAEYQISGLA